MGSGGSLQGPTLGGCAAESSPRWLGRRAGLQSLAGRVLRVWLGSAGAGPCRVVRGARRLAGQIGTRPRARVAGLLRLEALLACGPGAAQGVTPRWVRWGCRWPGGQVRHVVWRAGFLGSCGSGRWLCCRWRGGVCVWGWAWNDCSQAPSFSPRLLEGLSQASEDIRVVLRCEELGEVDSLGMERIGQHGFPCGLRHPTPRQLEAAVVRQPPAGRANQALMGGL